MRLPSYSPEERVLNPALRLKVALALVGFFLGPVTPKVLAAIGARVPPSLKGSVVSLLVGTGESASATSTAQ